MPPGKSPNSTPPDERKLQIFFGLAIAMVVIGLIAFVVLVIKDMQH